MKAFSLLLALAGTIAALFPQVSEAHHGRYDRHISQPIYIEVDRRAERLPLKRMLRERGINVDDYRLDAVTLHRSRKDARRAERRGYDVAGRLLVGERRTSYHELHGRATKIWAPRRMQNGRWQVHLTPGARVKGVSIHLTPKYYAYRDGPRRFRDTYGGRFRYDDRYHNNHRYRHGRYAHH